MANNNETKKDDLNEQLKIESIGYGCVEFPSDDTIETLITKARAMNPTAKHRTSSGRKLPAKSAPELISEVMIPSEENPIIKESILLAKEAIDNGKAVIPAFVTKSIVTGNSMDEFLSHAYLAQQQLKVAEELESKEEENEKKATASLPQTITVSDEMLSSTVTSTKLTAYDRAVLEAIYSQLMASPTTSNPVFSTRNLFKTMCGKQGGLKGSFSMVESQRDEVMKSVLKLMGTVVAIQATAKKADGTPITTTKYLNLVPAEVSDVNIAGNITTAIQIIKYPSFLSYAQYQKGISATPLDLLDIPLNMTARTLAVVNQLQHKLASVMYSHNAREERSKLQKENELYLEYNPIYASAHLRPMAESKMADSMTFEQTFCKRVRKTVREIADYWKEKGYILGWEEVKGKRGVAKGVIFLLPPLVEECSCYEPNVVAEATANTSAFDTGEALGNTN